MWISTHIILDTIRLGEGGHMFVEGFFTLLPRLCEAEGGGGTWLEIEKLVKL